MKQKLRLSIIHSFFERKNAMKTLLFLGLSLYIFTIAKAQHLNLSFETVELINGFENPSDWLAYGALDYNQDSHHGQRAVRINSYYGYYHTDLVLSKLYFRPIDRLSNIGIPFTQAIKKLSGWYKFQNIRSDRLDKDSAQVLVFLRRYLMSEQKSVVVGQGEVRLGGADNFTAFSLSVQQLYDIEPDTLVVIFSSLVRRQLDPKGGFIYDLNFSPTTCNGMPDRSCLYLTIDDLSLQFTTPTKNPRANLQPLQISPNPTDDKTVITWELPIPSRNVELSITDVLGRTLQRIQTDQNQVEVNTIDLPRGMYVVYLRQAGQLLGTERLLIAK